MTIDPVRLATHYSRFKVGERILLTGHAHQAWPDAGFEGHQRAWTDAAEQVDGKWAAAEERAGRVREGFARLIGDRRGNIALGQNTHTLLVALLSALPLRARPRIVTTDSEFSSARRQLRRLAEEGLEIVELVAHPVETLPHRLVAAVDDRTACVLVSSVLYATAEIVPGLDLVAAACGRTGTHLIVDAYHQINVVPFDVHALGLEAAFVTGGGYKYCQLGEGNAFLRLPDGCDMRPAMTGWFADVPEPGRVAPAPGDGQVCYGRGAAAFAGATYDPTSHYRAAAVLEFHAAQGMDPPALRAISRRQVGLLRTAFERLDLDPAIARVEAMPDERRAGFLAVRSPYATPVVADLRARGVFVDARGDILRVGPAPYVRDDQLTDGIAAIDEAIRGCARRAATATSSRRD